jgi:L-lactate dehydrogenase complex protein LldE
MHQPPTQHRVALFVTCLVDLFRPSVGFAAIKLLEQVGCVVEVPPSQVCCGQPAYNSGDRKTARGIASDVIAAFAGYEHVIVPSGSCTGMIHEHYPALFADDPVMAAKAQDLSARTVELVTFLDQRGVVLDAPSFEGKVTYHDACSGLRELGIKEQPRRLLGQIPGLSLTELADTEVCCGFGGTFCVKYPEISDHMVTIKAKAAAVTGAELLLAGDLGCLLNIAGKLKRLGSPVQSRHIAEVLAGMLDQPAIGEAK